MTPYRVGIVGLSWITTDPAGEATHPVLGTAVPGTHLSGMANLPNVQSPKKSPKGGSEADASWEIYFVI